MQKFKLFGGGGGGEGEGEVAGEEEPTTIDLNSPNIPWSN